MYIMSVCGAHGGQLRSPDSLELELHVAGATVWVLGT